MFLKLSLLLLGLSVGIATAFRVQLSLKTNQKVQELRGDTLVLAEQHQDLSKACFDYYNPRLNTIFATYENSYTHCINVYETNKDLVIEAYRDVRIQLENSYRDSCVTLSCCNQTANAFGAFTCTSTVVSSLLFVLHFIYISTCLYLPCRLLMMPKSSMRCRPTQLMRQRKARRTLTGSTPTNPSASTRPRETMSSPRLCATLN